MWETKKKPVTDFSVTGLKSVHDMIRTRGLLIRSQTLYPAELHAHIKKWWMGKDSNLRKLS